MDIGSPILHAPCSARLHAGRKQIGPGSDSARCAEQRFDMGKEADQVACRNRWPFLIVTVGGVTGGEADDVPERRAPEGRNRSVGAWFARSREEAPVETGGRDPVFKGVVETIIKMNRLGPMPDESPATFAANAPLLVF
jgi:hypothetical protein